MYSLITALVLAQLVECAVEPMDEMDSWVETGRSTGEQLGDEGESRATVSCIKHINPSKELCREQQEGREECSGS